MTIKEHCFNCGLVEAECECDGHCFNCGLVEAECECDGTGQFYYKKCKCRKYSN